jgi:hypothetical protein
METQTFCINLKLNPDYALSLKHRLINENLKT